MMVDQLQNLQTVRRLRAGPPPPSSERAEMRAAAAHGPYSYGRPVDRVAMTDEMRESVMARMKAAEGTFDPLVRPVFVWSFGFALTAGLVALFFH